METNKETVSAPLPSGEPVIGAAKNHSDKSIWYGMNAAKKQSDKAFWYGIFALLLIPPWFVFAVPGDINPWTIAVLVVNPILSLYCSVQAILGAFRAFKMDCSWNVKLRRRARWGLAFAILSLLPWAVVIIFIFGPVGVM
jgi:hypothetical protein